MTTVIDQAAIDRAERIWENIHHNGSRNGSSPELNMKIVMTVMDEWQEACSKVREELYARRKPYDKRRPIEDELDNILFIIEASFSFGWGSAPNDNDPECQLCESGDNYHTENCEKAMLWNYPEFAKIISARAKNLNITTQELIARALEPMKDGRGVRRRILEGLLGQEFVRDRIGESINASKRRGKGKRLEQKEEGKIGGNGRKDTQD
jgi:hypothetical protein